MSKKDRECSKDKLQVLVNCNFVCFVKNYSSVGLLARGTFSISNNKV